MNPKVVLSLHALLTADSLILGSLDSVSLRSSSPPGGSPNRRRRGNRRVRGEMHGGKSRVRWEVNGLSFCPSLSEAVHPARLVGSSFTRRLALSSPPYAHRCYATLRSPKG